MLLPKCVRAGKCLILQTINQTDLKPANQLNLGGVESVTVSRCIDELLTAKRGGNKTARYVKSLEHYLKQFTKGREQTPITNFTLSDVEKWMEKYPNPDTRRTWLTRISPLFSFCVRRGYVEKNPCDRVERVTCDRKPPLILTPSQSRELLAAAPTVMRPYVVLGMFAGIRPEEIMRLDWSQINLETKTVRVEGKTRRRRIVPLEPVAVAALERHPLKTGPVTPSNSTVVRWKHKARRQLGLARFPQDLLRHTAASYLLALHKDAAAVALRLGNSEKILMSHYHEPVTDADCAEFWRNGYCLERKPSAIVTIENQQVANPPTKMAIFSSLPAPS